MINKFFEYKFLTYTIWGNSVAEYVDVLLYFVGVLIVLFILQKFIMAKITRLAEKTSTDIDDTVVEFIHSIKPRLYIILAFYFTLRTLNLNDIVQNILDVIVIIIIVFQVTRSIQIIIEFAAQKFSGDEEDEQAKSAAQLLSAITTIAVWIFAIILILSNVGVNVTSLIAGVGIGGIAIAFALKEILSDLFSSFSIYFDKPFKVGDVIKVGEDIGEVQKVGIKTTRIKSRTGEELVVSNKDLTSSRVHNYKRMEHRNVRFEFIVEFDTPSEKLRLIPKQIEELLIHIDGTELVRVHLKEFGEWGLVYEVYHRIGSRDFTLYRDIQQEINFKIMEMLGEMSIDIAVPERRQ